MRDPTTKSFANLQTVFIAAERRLRTQRGQGFPQGIANNLADLQRALEGLTVATAQEREDAAALRVQNDNLQAAVNALQLQMAGFIPSNDTTVTVVTRQQPPAQNVGQQQVPQQFGPYNGRVNGAQWQALPAHPQYYQQQAPPTQPQYYQQQQNFQPAGSRRQRDRNR